MDCESGEGVMSGRALAVVCEPGRWQEVRDLAMAGKPDRDEGRRLRPRVTSVFKRVLQRVGQLTQDLLDIGLDRYLGADLAGLWSVAHCCRPRWVWGRRIELLGRCADFSALFGIGANGPGIEARCGIGRGRLSAVRLDEVGKLAGESQVGCGLMFGMGLLFVGDPGAPPSAGRFSSLVGAGASGKTAPRGHRGSAASSVVLAARNLEATTLSRQELLRLRRMQCTPGPGSPTVFRRTFRVEMPGVPRWPWRLLRASSTPRSSSGLHE
jgi:hypothetical protein